MFGWTIILVVTAVSIAYYYVKYLYSYWQRRGIPYLKPSLPFGNFSKIFTQKLTLAQQLAELYRSTTEPFIGIFSLLSPMLFIRDPKLIRDILITDFQYFTDRRFYMNEKDEPLTTHLTALRGQHWRDMRTNLTPAFTPKKMKMVIFPVLFECGNQLQLHLSKVVHADQAIEICEVIGCYSLNVMASTAFGIDVDCLANPNHPIRIAERKFFEVNMKNKFRFFCWLLHHDLLKWSGLRFVDRAVEEYFLKLVAEIIKTREQRNIVREDVFQLLIELHNGDTNTRLDNDDDEWKTVTKKGEQKALSFEQLAAQAFGLFIPGTSSTSLTITGCLYEIAKHPDIQQKVHAEIDHVMAQHNNQLTYESINELKYLDCCIDETLRKYQPLEITRVCVKDYKIPESSVIIEKGTTIIISQFSIHHDEKFYPDPEKFDPARFSSKVDKSLIGMPYLPFGDGPRNCFGLKVAKMIVKAGVYSILHQYYVDLDDQHIGKKIKIGANLHPIGGVRLKLKEKQFRN